MAQVSQTFDVSYIIYESISQEFNVPYIVWNLATNSFDGLYRVYVEGSNEFTAHYDIGFNFDVVSTFNAQYDIQGLLQKDFLVKYNITNNVIGDGFNAVYDIRPGAYNSFVVSYAIRFSLKEIREQQRAIIPYDRVHAVEPVNRFYTV